MVLAPYAQEHKSITGPGDSRPTALQIIKDQDLVGKLAGKVFLVTGGTPGGVGFETARALRETGADVFITARSQEKGDDAVKQLEAGSKGTGKLGVVVMDLGSLDSIKRGAQDFLKEQKTLNVLIENAGIMRCPPGTTQDGYEIQFGTNHIGHFLLFQLLKPTLLASSTHDFNSRVVILSSGAHRLSKVHFDDLHLTQFDKGTIPYMAYGQSKTANIWMANEIEKRYSSKGLHAWSLHPGLIHTNLGRHAPEAWDQVNANPDLVRIMKSVEQGAATSCWAAVSSELEGLGGKYLENCQISPPLSPDAPPRSGPNIPGHATHAYDDEGQKRLWEESLKMTGTTEA